VKTLPPYGKVGHTIRILGTQLTGTTRVTFNGAAARFTLAGPSEITASVPAGATTGEIRVSTPRGTFVSNLPFRVLP